MASLKTFRTRRENIVEGGIYHITQRAPGRELLFLEKNDYLYFLFLLKKVKKDFNLSIISFSLLPNHLHLFLKINELNLDKAMKRLFQGYAQYFNKKYQRKGHVFCGVYRASLCDRDDYLIAASIYIHLNGYKANLVSSPFLYKWHSLDVYIKPIKNSFIDKKVILNVLSNDCDEAEKIYKKLIGQACDMEYDDVMEDKKAINYFHERIFRYIKEEVIGKAKESSNFFDLEKEIEKFVNKKRISMPEDKKALRYLVEQLRSRGFSMPEIAKKLNYNRCHIYYLLSNKTG